MKASATVKTEGFADLLSTLEAFPKTYTRKAISPSLKLGMQSIVLPSAQKQTPVGKTTASPGQLRKSLKVMTAKGKRGARLSRGMLGWQVQAKRTTRIDAYYANWVFLGAKNRNGTKRQGSRTLRKALYNNEARYRSFVGQYVRANFPDVVREAKMAKMHSFNTHELEPITDLSGELSELGL